MDQYAIGDQVRLKARPGKPARLGQIERINPDTPFGTTYLVRLEATETERERRYSYPASDLELIIDGHTWGKCLDCGEECEIVVSEQLCPECIQDRKDYQRQCSTTK